MDNNKIRIMKNIVKNISLAAIVAFGFSTSVFALEGERSSQQGNGNSGNGGQGLAVNCTPSKKVILLAYNNAITPIYSNGLLWQNRANGVAGYEVPANSGRFALYSGGLWLGGTDVNGQLKAAVATFGAGNDYWTGPLDTLGTAEIQPDRCDFYDRFDTLRKATVQQFVAWYLATDEEKIEDFAGYTIPNSILNWPGNGNTALGEALRLAPFVDVNGDGAYEPERAGDYPFYDLSGDIDCRAPRKNRGESSTRPLFGDYTIWWVFNDKGNIHTESNAPGIGMEIHAQAFAFATNDEINSMTFYNYELINRSTFTLTNTYFGNWVDPDLGNASDDFVGCDVGRGLGYCYNGDEDDEDANGQTGYGLTPPAIGIDYFEGPYQDADSINNNYGTGIGEALNGLGYFNPNDQEPDSLVDNERFGMRRFVYHNNSSADNGDPSASAHYYNYLRGIWKNGQRMLYGGDGLRGPGTETVPTDFMFPGVSDSLLWGTNGVSVTNNNWSETNPGGGQPSNPVGDRRFLQSAGPFTLEPGNVNDITVGVVYGRAESGGRSASIATMFDADDKAQILFDNCFKVLSGPDAPDLTIQELNNELILYLDNSPTSNNFQEKYEEKDPNIVTPSALAMDSIFFDDKYRFQGYKVYQLSSDDVSVEEINDESKARLVAQVDIRDNVTQLVNYTFDDDIQANRPEVKVVGENLGIRHSFRVTTDLFATGDNRLVNFKTYYFVAIAYGYNEFKPYAQDVPPNVNNPLGADFNGQLTPYIASRQNGQGGSIRPVPAIPHNTFSEKGGSTLNSSFGDLVPISRLQGRGNGGFAVELTSDKLNRIGTITNGVYPDTLDYLTGFGPIEVKVVDPLAVKAESYILKVLNGGINDTAVSARSNWILFMENNPDGDTIKSDQTIAVENEQVVKNWGISLKIALGEDPGTRESFKNGFIGASLKYENPELEWLEGIEDEDGFRFTNWILSGQIRGGEDDSNFDKYFNDVFNGDQSRFEDAEEDYEGILGGIIAPYGLAQYRTGDTAGTTNDGIVLNAPGFNEQASNYSRLNYLSSVSIVFTKDKEKWTRVPVIELQEEVAKAQGRARRHSMRAAQSVDKDGNPAPVGAAPSTDPNDPAYISATGMGWFPGFAVDIETGERLNMAFGEDSWYGADNGADMLWNPTSTITTGTFNSENLVWGGKHYVYVFRKTLPIEPLSIVPTYRFPTYDAAQKLVSSFKSSNSLLRNAAWGSCSWVTIPVLKDSSELLATDVTMTVQVSRKLNSFYTPLLGLDPNSGIRNESRPVYKFNTIGLEPTVNDKRVLSEVISNIRVVPNPYYAYSQYERGGLDNIVKITNLPQRATVKIYNLAGTLIREYSKDSESISYIDWDLKNQANISISSGVYIIHVDIPGEGSKVIRWFGVMRPIDLNNF